MSVPSDNKQQPKTLPVISFKTLENYLEEFKDKPIPSHIDRSVFPSTMSGGNQVKLLSALKFLGLVSESGVPTETFGRLAKADKESRTIIWREIVTSVYSFLLDNLDIERATTRMVVDRFKEQGINGESIRKAQTFFMQAAKAARMNISPHIKLYLPPSRAARMSRPKSAAKTTEAISTEVDENSTSGRIEQKGHDTSTPKNLPYQLIDILSADMNKEEEDAVWTLIRYLKKKDFDGE